MFRARILPLFSVLALVFGLGLITSGSASADPQLSSGCAGLHQAALLSQGVEDTGVIQLQPHAYAEGEQLEFTATTDATRVGVAIYSGGVLRDGVGGVPGQPLRITIQATGEFRLELSSNDQDASVFWLGDCALPPTPVISSPEDGQTFAPGQTVPTSYACTPQSNPVATCTDSNGDGDGAGTLDTSVIGTHYYSVTGTDTSGFTATTTMSYTVAPAKQPQTISFTSTPPAHLTLVDSYQISATATSGLPVSYSVAPASAGVCMVMPGPFPFTTVVYPTATGTCTIDADQAGDDRYLAAPQVSQSFTVYKIPTTLVAQKACRCLLGLTPTTFKATLSWTHPMGPGTVTEGLPGQPVAMYVGGKVVCTATTDSTGLATCKATLGLGAGISATNYTAVYAGTTSFEGAVATAPLQ
jgi:hypothetical protein